MIFIFAKRFHIEQRFIRIESSAVIEMKEHSIKKKSITLISDSDWALILPREVGERIFVQTIAGDETIGF